MCPLYDCASSTNKISTVLKTRPGVCAHKVRKQKGKKNKKFLRLTEKEVACLFCPERARGGGRSILGRYRCCYSGYLFLNPLAVDIPPIGEVMVGASQYSLPILVTAALINQGSYCSSWAHLYTRLIVTRFHPVASEPIYEATGRPSDQFPNFWVNCFEMLIWAASTRLEVVFFVFFFHLSPRSTLKLGTFQGFVEFMRYRHTLFFFLSFFFYPHTSVDRKDAIRALFCSCPCGFYDNCTARAPRTGRK